MKVLQPMRSKRWALGAVIHVANIDAKVPLDRAAGEAMGPQPSLLPYVPGSSRHIGDDDDAVTDTYSDLRPIIRMARRGRAEGATVALHD